jgi:hypothetical protein
MYFSELHYTNGDVFAGQWIDNRKEGEGEMRSANGGRVILGEWRDDKMILKRRNSSTDQ